MPTNSEPPKSDLLQAESAADSEPASQENVSGSEMDGRGDPGSAGVGDGYSADTSHGENAPGPELDFLGPPIALADPGPIRTGLEPPASITSDDPASAGAESAGFNDDWVSECLGGSELSRSTSNGASKLHKRMHLTDCLPRGVGMHPEPSPFLSFSALVNVISKGSPRGVD